METEEQPIFFDSIVQYKRDKFQKGGGGSECKIPLFLNFQNTSIGKKKTGVYGLMLVKFNDFPRHSTERETDKPRPYVYYISNLLHAAITDIIHQ
jgi:hypothetical protein